MSIMNDVDLLIMHEAGHAVSANSLGQPAGAIIWTKDSKGIPYGCVQSTFTKRTTEFVTFLFSGLAATYVMHPDVISGKLGLTVRDLVKWSRLKYGQHCVDIAQDDLVKVGFVEGELGIYLYSQMPIVNHYAKELQQAIDLLSKNRIDLQNLADYCKNQGRSIGKRELRQLLNNQTPRWWARCRDFPILQLVRHEHWKSRRRKDKNR